MAGGRNGAVRRLAGPALGASELADWSQGGPSMDSASGPSAGSLSIAKPTWRSVCSTLSQAGWAPEVLSALRPLAKSAWGPE
eukprot:13225280-Alexandrium_andersonii.AAC.1